MAHVRPFLVRLDDRLTPTTLPTGYSEALLAGGLTDPTGMAVAPDGRVFVTEKTGAIRVVQNGALLTTPFATLTVDSQGDRGLLGIVLDPNFATDGYLYVYSTVPANAATNTPAYNQVTRYTSGGNVAASGSAAAILKLDGLSATDTSDNGGALAFGADGTLFVGVGDNGTSANSQSLTSRLGKILRINPNGTVPADNPTAFAGVNGTTTDDDRSIWAVGLRNPTSLASDPVTGKLYVTDSGLASYEEIDAGAAGANYGWPATEGRFDQTKYPNYTEPVYAYAHGFGSSFVGSAVSGGVFYDPKTLQFPGQDTGAYYFADAGGRWVNRLDPATGAVTAFATGTTGAAPVALATAPDGSLLYLDGGTGSGTSGVYAVRFAAGTPSVAVGPGAGADPVVDTFNPTTGVQTGTVPVFDSTFTGGVRVATADVTGDRVPDTVVAAGPGGSPRVQVIDGATGQVVKDFFAFESTFTGGVYVAAADVNHDGYADLILSPDQGGGPRIRVVDGKTGATIDDFFAFETTFTGGVRTAVGDLNGDGTPDLLVSAGYGGGPRVAEFDGKTILAASTAPTRLIPDFFAFESSLRNGAYVAAADLDGDGYADQILGAGPGGGPRVRVFSAKTATLLGDFFAGDATSTGGVTVAGTTIAADGTAGFVTGSGPGVKPTVLGYTLSGGAITQARSFSAFDPTMLDGVYVG